MTSINIFSRDFSKPLWGKEKHGVLATVAGGIQEARKVMGPTG
jgi:hypothetical protein